MSFGLGKSLEPGVGFIFPENPVVMEYLAPGGPHRVVESDLFQLKGLPGDGCILEYINTNLTKT